MSGIERELVAGYSNISVAEAESCVSAIRSQLPDTYEMLYASFTGSRAFGWGSDVYDIDVHGFMLAPGGINKIHATDVDLDVKSSYDVTLINVDSLDEPELPHRRWIKYYDLSRPIFVAEKFDPAVWWDGLGHDRVLHVYPDNVGYQINRMFLRETIRSALHSYKELLIPIHYLRTGEIESNVVERIPHESALIEDLAEQYANRERNGFNREAVSGELQEYWEELAQLLRASDEVDYNDNPRFERYRL